jgi:hypothetical protein
LFLNNSNISDDQLNTHLRLLGAHHRKAVLSMALRPEDDPEIQAQAAEGKAEGKDGEDLVIVIAKRTAELVKRARSNHVNGLRMRWIIVSRLVARGSVGSKSLPKDSQHKYATHFFDDLRTMAQLRKNRTLATVQDRCLGIVTTASQSDLTNTAEGFATAFKQTFMLEVLGQAGPRETLSDFNQLTAVRLAFIGTPFTPKMVESLSYNFDQELRKKDLIAFVANLAHFSSGIPSQFQASRDIIHRETCAPMRSNRRQIVQSDTLPGTRLERTEMSVVERFLKNMRDQGQEVAASE